MNSRSSPRIRYRFSLLDFILVAALSVLYLIGLRSYLLFHELAEIIRVSVIVAIFMLVWNVRRSIDNPYLLFVGVAYVFVCALEILHALASQGLDVFPADGGNLSAQLWIASRYLESLSLVTAPFFRARSLKIKFIIAGFTGVTALAIASILVWRIFPVCLEAGQGPTPFMLVSELLIGLTFAAAIGLLLRRRDRFDPAVVKALGISIGFSILSELSMAFHAGDHGFPFIMGHLFKIVAFYFIYKAIVETGLARPLAVLYRDLKESEMAAARLNEELEARVGARTDELRRANALLRLEINDRRRIEEDLRRSEEKYRIVADNTYDWEWWRSPSGNFIYVSPACLRITGREAAEFLNDPGLLMRIIHPEDAAVFNAHQDLVEAQAAAGEIEFRIVRPDGSVRWIAHACQPVVAAEGGIGGRRGSNRDITDRRRAEQSLRESEGLLRRLSTQVLSAQETERRRVARELHDDLGGLLAVLKLRISFIERSLRADQLELREECRQVLDQVDQMIDGVARMSRDLSPSILEDLGLIPALRRLIENFGRVHQIHVVSDLHDGGHPLAQDTQIMAYRVVQEALTNVGKHARANSIVVRVTREAGRLRLSVEDDGVGFDVPAARATRSGERGLGLATMMERARMVGGVLEIRSEVGQGTRITLDVPDGGEGAT